MQKMWFFDFCFSDFLADFIIKKLQEKLQGVETVWVPASIHLIFPTVGPEGHQINKCRANTWGDDRRRQAPGLVESSRTSECKGLGGRSPLYRSIFWSIFEVRFLAFPGISKPALRLIGSDSLLMRILWAEGHQHYLENSLSKNLEIYQNSLKWSV